MYSIANVGIVGAIDEKQVVMKFHIFVLFSIFCCFVQEKKSFSLPLSPSLPPSHSLSLSLFSSPSLPLFLFLWATEEVSCH